MPVGCHAVLACLVRNWRATEVVIAGVARMASMKPITILSGESPLPGRSGRMLTEPSSRCVPSALVSWTGPLSGMPTPQPVSTRQAAAAASQLRGASPDRLRRVFGHQWQRALAERAADAAGQGQPEL